MELFVDWGTNKSLEVLWALVGTSDVSAALHYTHKISTVICDCDPGAPAIASGMSSPFGIYRDAETGNFPTGAQMKLAARNMLRKRLRVSNRSNHI